ncbi:MAG: hypothetical protein M1818_002731 [Claussenomyces sp. TS43310]|nr:MAG: hypothetical protein M1818_002731 [Claussenomyces sp. TS43310]
MAAQSDLTADQFLIERVSAYVEQYMSHYDGSHDYNHILRVLGLARRITASSRPGQYDAKVVSLAALLHDVGDKKYLQPGQDSMTVVQDVLLELGVERELAAKIQTIVTAVSYSSEMKDPVKVQDVIRQYPELAVVQDADRLDAIGAIGIGRTFTFGGAMHGRDSTRARKDASGTTGSEGRGMLETIDHFEDKLLRLEGTMKTEAGRRMARERTERLITFCSWWNDEMDVAKHGLDLKL